jgi:hypothetical protein
MTIKSTIARKVTNALVLASLLAGSMAVINSTPVQAKTCGVGYSLSNGKCVNITKQRSVVEKNSKKMSAAFICLGLKDWTPAKHKACMASKGYK